MEADNRRQAEDHATKYKVYLNEKSNVFKGVMRSRELSLATLEKLTAVLRN